MKPITTTEFWNRIEILGANDCWEWQRNRQKSGHGHQRIRGKTVSAHRHAYELTYGPIPPGLIVRHTCDNPPCCNPAHLIVGTHGDNARDRRDRGRGFSPKGSLNGRAKLTSQQVKEIRSSSESQVVLANRYNVGRSTIQRVLARTNWKEVDQ